MSQASPSLPSLRVRRLHPQARLPGYGTAGAAGLDLAACLPDGPRAIAPGTWHSVPTGLAMALPPGHEGQVRPRSGVARRRGVTVLNAPGTIDEDYRGEVMVLLINHGDAPFVVEDGDRIAQLVVAPVTRVAVDDGPGELDRTERGQGGFGSTGR